MSLSASKFERTSNRYVPPRAALTSTAIKRRAPDSDEDDSRRSTKLRIGDKDEAGTAQASSVPSSSYVYVESNDAYTTWTSRSAPDAMRVMLERKRFWPEQVRTSRTSDGYYWVFEASKTGDEDAKECYDYVQGRQMMGISMKLRLYPRSEVR